MSLAQRAAGWLFDAVTTPRVAARHAFYFSARERWRDRVRYAFGELSRVNERDRALLPLPEATYLFLRLFRLLARYGNPFRIRHRWIGR